MAQKVLRNDWLEEEFSELARDGFRTLVVAKKMLTLEQYKDFEVSFILKHKLLARRPMTFV